MKPRSVNCDFHAIKRVYTYLLSYLFRGRHDAFSALCQDLLTRWAEACGKMITYASGFFVFTRCTTKRENITLCNKFTTNSFSGPSTNHYALRVGPTPTVQFPVEFDKLYQTLFCRRQSENIFLARTFCDPSPAAPRGKGSVWRGKLITPLSYRAVQRTRSNSFEWIIQ